MTKEQYNHDAISTQRGIRKVTSLDAAIGATIAVINMLFLALSIFINLSVKAAISSLEVKMESNRRVDAEEVRRWVEDKLSSHCDACVNYGRRLPVIQERNS